MVPGNLFSAKKVNSRTGPRGSNKEGFWCQKSFPEAGGQRVGKRWIVGQQRWKSRRKAVENGSASGGN
jgi:hypothetical protein